MKRYQAIGAYVFGGGFSLGVSARFAVIRHLADDNYGVKTLRANFPAVPVDVGLGTWNAMSYRGGVDFVYGNPPCAAWSMLKGAGRYRSWGQDARVTCTRNLFGLLNDVRPTIWAWESVDQAFTVGRPLVDELTQRALSLGYSVSHVRMNACHHGCDHVRRRYFMIAHRVAIDWERNVTFNTPSPVREVLRPYERCGQRDPALLLSAAHEALWWVTQPGKSLSATFDRVTPEEDKCYRTLSTGRKIMAGRPAFAVYRLDPNRVCPTIVGSLLTHYKFPRYLSLTETKRLCGYPADWQLEGSGSGRYSLLARAVMPPVGVWLAGIAWQALRRNAQVGLTARVIDLRNWGNVQITNWEKEA